MKFLIITNLYPPYARGGAERVAELQARGLRAAGHEVVVLTTGPDFFLKEFVEDGVRVLRYRPLNIFWYKNIGHYPFLLRMVWHKLDAIAPHGLYVFRRAIDQENPDVIISHNLRGMGMTGVIALSNENKHWVHVVHDIQLAVLSGIMEYGKEMTQDSLISRYWQWYCRGLFNSPRVVLSPSKWLLDFYKEKGFFKDSKLEVLANPVEDFGMLDRKESKKVRFLFLGQIEPQKGVNWLARHIKELGGDWELKIVGAGSAIGDLERIVNGDERIKILGKKSRDEIKRIFADTDILIVPSLIYENSPAVIYEALAAGVSVLAANIGGVAELISENKNGWTFEPNNNQELLEKLEEAVREGKYIEMGDDCRASVAGSRLGNYIEKLLNLVE